ncbi:MAG: indole-3-glycerol phosphate synthase TrpC [Alphaproteobacteria bacterium]
MSDILAEICDNRRAHVARLKAEHPLSGVAEAAAAANPPRGFGAALARAAAKGYGLIAEIKRASPSAGLIREDFDVANLAQAYETGGATCLSVLTEEHYFKGCGEDLGAARAATALPILRKDFIVDGYQITESRALGADCVLLIMAVLADAEAQDFAGIARGHGMDVLVEVHDETELERALALEDGLIGINNRNLKTLETDLATTERLAPLVPAPRIIVSESGLNSPDDLARMAALGAKCFLVGEALMRQDDIEGATRRLLGDDGPF